MSFQLRPAVRQNTPLIIGVAGPTKSGKTYSAHRIAQGLAPGGRIAMLNAEGARGHQYADRFNYLAADISAPYSYTRYDEAVASIALENPDVLIIDSMSHAHDGPGGMLEEHENVMNRMAGDKTGKGRDAYTWSAWNVVKRPENAFVYRLLNLDCPIILCFRAKEKIKIVPGKQPEDLGWQPIVSDRVAFETMVTLMFTPHCRGIPSLEYSDLREPFDEMMRDYFSKDSKGGRSVDEAIGAKMREWAAGATTPSAPTQPSAPTPPNGAPISADQAIELTDRCHDRKIAVARLCKAAGVTHVEQIPADKYVQAKQWIEGAKV
jgi:hypothetical protein